MRCVTTGLDATYVYIGDAIVLDPTPTLRVKSIKGFPSSLEEHSLNLYPENSLVRATAVDFLEQTVSSSSLPPRMRNILKPW